MSVVFRVDASINIGIGHVMRCLTLADEIKKTDSDILFICRELKGNLRRLINKRGFEVSLIHHNLEGKKNNKDFSWLPDVNETIDIIRNINPTWLIIDHYGIDYRWHDKIRKHTNQIMVIDDLANRQMYCDLLLDNTIGRVPKDYYFLTNNDCEFLLGPEYSLIRHEFREYRILALKKQLKDFAIRNILVSMGGMDFNNITEDVINSISALDWSPELVVNVVLSELAPNINSVEKLSKKTNININIITSPKSMAKLMFEADISIGASGSSAWERCSLGLPTLAICTAENQLDIFKELDNLKVHFSADINGKYKYPSLISQLKKIKENPSILEPLIGNSFHICDTLGANRVESKMWQSVTKDGKNFDIKNVSSKDIQIIFDWQSHPKTREFSKNSHSPSWDEHTAWVNRKINDLNSVLWLLLHDNQPCGVLRLDHVDHGLKNGYMISIFVDPLKYRLGIATLAIQTAKKFFSKFTLYAEILDQNKNSLLLFDNAEFKFQEDLSCYVWKCNNRG
jgi:UDP-2,4-diacetamido-2,4,6-trideoxy-beta-L-altropyranose hydrolase